MKKYIPSIMWASALALLFFMDASSRYSFCLFKMLGFGACPGCGIGHSIHYTLHFQWKAALSSHILGIPSTIALCWLIIKPFIHKPTFHESTIINDAGASA